MGAVLLQEKTSRMNVQRRPRKTPGRSAYLTRRLGTCASNLLHLSPTKKRPIHTWARPASSGGLLKNFRKYLYRTEFTVLTNCSVIKNFFNNTDHASRVVQSWKVELLQFHFVIQHRPARMI